MTVTLVLDLVALLCTLAALIGLPLGYGIGWCWDAVTAYARMVSSIYAAVWAFDVVVSEAALHAWAWEDSEE